MASTFNGWGDSWGTSWGGEDTPGAMRGSASFGFTTSATLTALVATPAENPRYSQAERDHAHWRQLREEDDVLLALLQQFVMEEA